MAGDDESCAVSAESGSVPQATADGTCPAPTADGERLIVPLQPPSSTSSGLTVTLSVDGLTLPDRDLPTGVVPPNATSGCSWIAYWLVDWDYNGDVFRIHEWSIRTRGASTPASALAHNYVHPGRHTIAVRAIDLLGGVITATLDVDL